MFFSLKKKKLYATYRPIVLYTRIREHQTGYEQNPRVPLENSPSLDCPAMTLNFILLYYHAGFFQSKYLLTLTDYVVHEHIRSHVDQIIDFNLTL